MENVGLLNRCSLKAVHCIAHFGGDSEWLEDRVPKLSEKPATLRKAGFRADEDPQTVSKLHRFLDSISTRSSNLC